MIASALSLMERLSPTAGAGAAGSAAPLGETGIPAPTFGGEFGELLSDTVGAMHKAESVSLDALHGKAETREAVDAVMNAEQSLQAAIAIRDKIVTAYLEISRMAI